MANKPHDIASEISAEGGEVHIDGPGGTAMSMTPKAALETADRLVDRATDAAGQRLMKSASDERPN